MSITNRECLLCGTGYYYCHKCSGDSDKPTWLISFCSEKCKDIYKTAMDVSHDVISKDDAFKILSKYTIEDYENEIPKTPGIRGIVKDILENHTTKLDEVKKEIEDGEVKEEVKEDVEEVKPVVNENKNQNNKFNNKSFYKNNK